MIQSTSLTFLKNLNKNNNKEWFDAHKKDYEAAKSDFLSLSSKLITGLSDLDEGIRKADLDLKKCITRINRDVRFSADKTPYKPNFFLILNEGGKKSPLACYFLHLEPGGKSFAGGGVYMPPAPELLKFREEIKYEFAVWKKIVLKKEFLKAFPEGIQAPEVLKNVPRGFEPTDPAAEYLKMKGFFALRYLSDEELQSNNLLKSLLKLFQTAKPLVDFLNRGIR
jgi:uncharacterized protein (TIGR02453 family)